MPFLRSLVFILLSASSLYGQVILQGAVRDAETSEPLSYANIYIKDTYIGTASNDEGEYVLQIPQLPAVLVVSYLGYETVEVTIDTPVAKAMDITLTRTALELEDVVVKAGGEDPGMRIMREVIARKIRNRGRLKTYQAHAYTRTRFENDTSAVSISESFSVLYWDHNAGSFEDYIESNTSEQLSYLASQDLGSKDINIFTQDIIPIVNFDFVGPTHPDALKYYDFVLTGREYLNDKIVYEISCTPKSRVQPLFEGTVSVLDEDYVLLAVDLSIAGAFGFHPMLQNFKGRYRQKYSSFGKEFWLPVDCRTEEELIFDMGLFAFPKIKFRKISILSDYEVNADIAEDITRLAALDESAPADTVEREPSIPTDDFARVPLNEAERKLFEEPDTSMTMFRAFRPHGLLAPILLKREDEIEEALRTSGEYAMGTSLQSKLGYEAWLNRAEGYHLGLKYRHDFAPYLRTDLVGGYETHTEKGFYDAQLSYIYRNRDPEKSLFIRYFDRTVPVFAASKYSQMVASLLPLGGGADYFDYYRSQSISAGIRHGIDALQTHVSLQVSSEDHSSLERQYECDTFDAGFDQRPNPPISEGQVNAVTLGLEYDARYEADFYERTFGDHKFTNLGVTVEHSSEDFLGSDVEYTQATGFLDVTWKTFFRRRPDFNYLRTRLVGSTCDGDLPLQKLVSIDGSLLAYSPFGVFQTRLNRPTVGDQMAALFWEYNFTSIPYELLGLRYCAQNKWEFSLHGAHGRTWLDDDRKALLEQYYPPHYKDDIHHELGVSVTMKYHFMGVKFDLTQDLDTRNYFVGFSLQMVSLSID